MADRAHAYRWVGEMRPDGYPTVHLGNHDLEPADLDPDRTAALTDRQVEMIGRYPNLYEPITKTAWDDEHKLSNQPKWYQEIVAKAEAAGQTAAPRLADETQKAYLERNPPAPTTEETGESTQPIDTGADITGESDNAGEDSGE